MYIKYSCTNGKLVIDLFPEEEEYEGKRVKLNQKSCQIQLPNDWDLTKVHPDALAVATIFLVYPFAKKKIELSIGISSFFAEECKRIIKKEIGPIDPTLRPRRAKVSDKLALAYSGGVDSTAAASIIPEESPLFFVDRIILNNASTIYNKQAAYYACDEMRKQGRKVYQIKTDFEYIRDPIGFPVDLACCIPAILMSDYEGIDSIAAGIIAESAYKIGHENYKNYTKSWHYNVWGKLCNTVELPLSLVTAGLSEVCTTLIVDNSPYKGISESCMRGRVGESCMKCMKCFRKKLLEEVLEKGELSEENLAIFFLNPGAFRTILYTPMKHQNVMAYIMKHYQGENETIKAFKEKMGADLFELEYLKKWYPASREVIAPRYQEYVEAKIKEYLDVMNDAETKLMESWDLKEFMESDRYKVANSKLKGLLK